MKTTIDLPEDLVTDAKIRAAQERRKMKEVTAEALRTWLSNSKVSIASVTTSDLALNALQPRKNKDF